jgi:hypothetical protein
MTLLGTLVKYPIRLRVGIGFLLGFLLFNFSSFIIATVIAQESTNLLTDFIDDQSVNDQEKTILIKHYQDLGKKIQSGTASLSEIEFFLTDAPSIISRSTSPLMSAPVRAESYLLLNSILQTLELLPQKYPDQLIPPEINQQLQAELKSLLVRNAQYRLPLLMSEKVAEQFQLDQVVGSLQVQLALANGHEIAADNENSEQDSKARTASQNNALNKILFQNGRRTNAIARADYLSFSYPIGIWSEETRASQEKIEAARNEEISKLQTQLANEYPDFNLYSPKQQQELAQDLFWKTIDYNQKIKAELDRLFPVLNLNEQLKKWNEYKRDKNTKDFTFIEPEYEKFETEIKRLSENERVILNRHLKKVQDERRSQLFSLSQAPLADQSFLSHPSFPLYMTILQIDKFIEEVQNDPAARSSTFSSIYKLVEEAGLNVGILGQMAKPEVDVSEWPELWLNQTQLLRDSFDHQLRNYQLDLIALREQLNAPAGLIDQAATAQHLKNFLALRPSDVDNAMDPFLSELIGTSLTDESAIIRSTLLTEILNPKQKLIPTKEVLPLLKNYLSSLNLEKITEQQQNICLETCGKKSSSIAQNHLQAFNQVMDQKLTQSEAEQMSLQVFSQLKAMNEMDPPCQCQGTRPIDEHLEKMLKKLTSSIKLPLIAHKPLLFAEIQKSCQKNNLLKICNYLDQDKNLLGLPDQAFVDPERYQAQLYNCQKNHDFSLPEFSMSQGTGNNASECPFASLGGIPLEEVDHGLTDIMDYYLAGQGGKQKARAAYLKSLHQTMVNSLLSTVSELADEVEYTGDRYREANEILRKMTECGFPGAPVITKMREHQNKNSENRERAHQRLLALLGIEGHGRVKATEFTRDLAQYVASMEYLHPTREKLFISDRHNQLYQRWQKGEELSTTDQELVAKLEYAKISAQAFEHGPYGYLVDLQPKTMFKSNPLLNLYSFFNLGERTQKPFFEIPAHEQENHAIGNGQYSHPDGAKILEQHQSKIHRAFDSAVEELKRYDCAHFNENALSGDYNPDLVKEFFNTSTQNTSLLKLPFWAGGKLADGIRGNEGEKQDEQTAAVALLMRNKSLRQKVLTSHPEFADLDCQFGNDLYTDTPDFETYGTVIRVIDWAVLVGASVASFGYGGAMVQASVAAFRLTPHLGGAMVSGALSLAASISEGVQSLIDVKALEKEAQIKQNSFFASMGQGTTDFDLTSINQAIQAASTQKKLAVLMFALAGPDALGMSLAPIAARSFAARQASAGLRGLAKHRVYTDTFQNYEMNLANLWQASKASSKGALKLFTPQGVVDTAQITGKVLSYLPKKMLQQIRTLGAENDWLAIELTIRAKVPRVDILRLHKELFKRINSSDPEVSKQALQFLRVEAMNARYEQMTDAMERLTATRLDDTTLAKNLGEIIGESIERNRTITNQAIPSPIVNTNIERPRLAEEIIQGRRSVVGLHSMGGEQAISDLSHAYTQAGIPHKVVTNDLDGKSVIEIETSNLYQLHSSRNYEKILRIQNKLGPNGKIVISPYQPNHRLGNFNQEYDVITLSVDEGFRLVNDEQLLHFPHEIRHRMFHRAKAQELFTPLHIQYSRSRSSPMFPGSYGDSFLLEEVYTFSQDLEDNIKLISDLPFTEPNLRGIVLQSVSNRVQHYHTILKKIQTHHHKFEDYLKQQKSRIQTYGSMNPLEIQYHENAVVIMLPGLDQHSMIYPLVTSKQKNYFLRLKELKNKFSKSLPREELNQILTEVKNIETKLTDEIIQSLETVSQIMRQQDDKLTEIEQKLLVLNSLADDAPISQDKVDEIINLTQAMATETRLAVIPDLFKNRVASLPSSFVPDPKVIEHFRLHQWAQMSAHTPDLNVSAIIKEFEKDFGADLSNPRYQGLYRRINLSDETDEISDNILDLNISNSERDKIKNWAKSVLDETQSSFPNEPLKIRSVSVWYGMNVDHGFIHQDAGKLYLHGTMSIQGPSTVIFSPKAIEKINASPGVTKYYLEEIANDGRARIRRQFGQSKKDELWIDPEDFYQSPTGSTVIFTSEDRMKKTGAEAVFHSSPPFSQIQNLDQPRLTFVIEMVPDSQIRPIASTQVRQSELPGPIEVPTRTLPEPPRFLPIFNDRRNPLAVSDPIDRKKIKSFFNRSNGTRIEDPDYQWAGKAVSKQPDKTDVIQFTFDDRNYGVLHNRIYENISPQQLPVNKHYNYVILDDGSMVYGELVDAWEYGVKHPHLALNRTVLAAGEVYIDDTGKIFFNVESGKFTKNILKNAGLKKSELGDKVKKAFGYNKNNDNLFYQENLPRPSKPPASEELIQLCRDVIFILNNSHLCNSLRNKRQDIQHILFQLYHSNKQDFNFQAFDQYVQFNNRHFDVIEKRISGILHHTTMSAEQNKILRQIMKDLNKAKDMIDEYELLRLATLPDASKMESIHNEVKKLTHKFWNQLDLIENIPLDITIAKDADLTLEAMEAIVDYNEQNRLIKLNSSTSREVKVNTTRENISKEREEILKKSPTIKSSNGRMLELDIMQEILDKYPEEFVGFNILKPAQPPLVFDPSTGIIDLNFSKPNLIYTQDGVHNVFGQELDIELNCCILEISAFKETELRKILDNGVQDNRKGKIDTLTRLGGTNPEYSFINPQKKPVIFYAPNSQLTPGDITRLQSLNVYYARTLEELHQLIQKFRLSSSSFLFIIVPRNKVSSMLITPPCRKTPPTINFIANV